MERSIGLVFGLAVLSPSRFRSVREFYPCGCCTATALETEVEVPEIMPQNLVKMVPRQTLPPRWHFKVAHLSTVRSLLQGSGV